MQFLIVQREATPQNTARTRDTFRYNRSGHSTHKSSLTTRTEIRSACAAGRASGPRGGSHPRRRTGSCRPTPPHRESGPSAPRPRVKGVRISDSELGGRRYPGHSTPRPVTRRTDLTMRQGWAGTRTPASSGSGARSGLRHLPNIQTPRKTVCLSVCLSVSVYLYLDLSLSSLLSLSLSLSLSRSLSSLPPSLPPSLFFSPNSPLACPLANMLATETA